MELVAADPCTGVGLGDSEVGEVKELESTLSARVWTGGATPVRGLHQRAPRPMELAVADAAHRSRSGWANEQLSPPEDPP